MDIMDSCRRTDRASDAAREALLEAKTKGRAKSSLAKVCSWMERDESNWYDSIGDPSAGDFCGVLEALDGEIAVEFYNPYTDVTCYIYSMEGDETFSWCDFRESSLIAGVAYMENIVTMEKGELRLLHRDDTQELPGAVQEAMEGEQ